MQELRFADPGGSVRQGRIEDGKVRAGGDVYELPQITLLSPVEGLTGQFGALRAPADAERRLCAAAGVADVYRGQAWAGRTLICAALDRDGKIYSCACGPAVFEAEERAQVWLSGRRVEGPCIRLGTEGDVRLTADAECFEARVGDIVEVRGGEHALVVVLAADSLTRQGEHT